jgi:uncharacterized protein
MLQHFRTLLLIAVTCCLTAQQAAFGQSLQLKQDLSPGIRTVSTYGSSQVYVQPNKVTILIAVKTFEKTLESARSENESATRRVMALATRYKIDKDDVQTNCISIQPVYPEGRNEYTYTPVTKAVGYSIEQTIGFVIHKPNIVGQLLNDAINAGANSISSVAFENTDLRKYRDQARLEAVKAAQEKATALADELEMKLGKPLFIQEESSSSDLASNIAMAGNNASNARYGQSNEAESNSISFALGKLAISATVQVVFEMH